jgi:hypothetical protein
MINYNCHHARYSYYTIRVHQIVLTRIPKNYGDYNSVCICEVANDRLIEFASRRIIDAATVSKK